jgi:LmbE family N-acetylglucosaminyl deacetylase
MSGVVIVIAHPDDEVFVSGTICLCVERGFKVMLVCVTDDENGPGSRHGGLGGLRKQELTNSARALGVSEVSFLGFADVANPDSQGADSWDQTRLIQSLGQILQVNEPQLVLTHGPLGGYGHNAHRLVHRCVMAAAKDVSFARSVFSFCGQVNGAFFSWHFDQPSDVEVNARGFQSARCASLSSHRSQIDFFLQPYPPRTARKVLSALFGWFFAWTEAGRKRVPIGTVARFFERFPIEGLALQKAPSTGRLHFFREHFANDDRVRFDS